MSTLSVCALEMAVAEWTAALGPENVETAREALAAAETATFDIPHRIPAILRPFDREQVQECVRIANRHKVPLYPISSGFNWGYGSRAPAADRCALLELGRMKRIVDYSEELAYVTVEPGVTQADLQVFLKKNNSRLWMDATGSTPLSSLIGNTVERGFGHTPYGDHFANVCGLEVVLANGDVVETGFSRFPNAQAGSVYKWGVGPSIDGLFSQSNFGIVTRLTVWLMPAPEHFQAYFFRTAEDAGLESIVDALRPLRLNNVIRSSVHIANDYKVLSSLQQYPWEDTGGATPLRPEQMPRYRKRDNFGAWNGSGAFYGTRGQVAEARRLLKLALRGKVDRLQFLDDRLLGLAGRFARPFKLLTGWDLSRTLELVKPVYGLMRGEPTDHPLRSTYWRMRGPVPETKNPDADRCGLLWCAPVAPMQSEHVRRVVNAATETLLDGGYEPMISITLITERSCACIITVAYDRTLAGEDGRAMAAYQALLRRLWADGYYSYRLGIQSMGELVGNNGFNRTLQSLRRCLDPAGILAPGRYQATE